MKQTRMKKHEEKLKALAKRRKKIITISTLIGLICPATLGTIQALADETIPLVELTETVTEPVTPEQPAEPQNQGHEAVIPETEQSATQTAASAETGAPTIEGQTASAVERAQVVAPLSNPSVVAEYRAKLANYQAQANALVSAGATTEQMVIINILLSEFSTNIDSYENDIGDVPAVWLADIDSGIIPALEVEIQTVSEQLSQPDLSTLHAKWQADMAAIQALLDELESKVAGTSFQDRYTGLWNRWDTAFITGVMFPQNVRDQAFYDYWLPELASILADLQQLKADISNELTVSVTDVTLFQVPEMRIGGTYMMIANVLPENATNKNLTWSSSNPAVATVSSIGEVTPISEGTVTITVTTVDGGFTASTSSTVIKDGGKPTKDFDYTAVLVAIARYAAMIEDDYTTESWQAMEAEMINNDSKLHLIDYLKQLPNVESTVPPGYENQFQTDLNAFAAKAQSIMDMATKKTPGKVDDSKLEEAIKNAEDKIKQGGWESIKDLEEAIAKGKEILADDNRTQEAIDKATKAINDASNALKKADNNGNDGGNNSGSNQNGNNNGNNADAGKGSGNKTQNTSNNQKNKANSSTTSSNGNLPQTGEERTIFSLTIGSLLAFFASMILFRKKKKI